MTDSPVTQLARDMGVRCSKGMDPLSGPARRKLNVILRDLDAEERESLVMLDAVGRYDWHMVDGTGRVWHFTADGRVGWNDYADNVLDDVQCCALAVAS